MQAHSTLVVERRKRRKAGNFANPLRAEKPFQTLQRLQDAAKIGTASKPVPMTPSANMVKANGPAIGRKASAAWLVV